ncbi:MAG: ATP synthase F0 subunit C [Polyangiaceae bacterium]
MSLKNKLSLVVATVTSVLMVPAIAIAQSSDASANNHDTMSWLALGSAIAIGLAALGGTTAQGRATAAALEGIARQPSAAGRIQTPMILGLALIESLVLFALVIAYLLQSKITLG